MVIRLSLSTKVFCLKGRLFENFCLFTLIEKLSDNF